MFLYVYVDILGLYMPAVIDDIREGRVWELDINQQCAFGALVLMAIPISMVALSTALPARTNRRAQLAVASLYVIVSAGHAIGESWTYYFTSPWASRCSCSQPSSAGPGHGPGPLVQRSAASSPRPGRDAQGRGSHFRSKA
jgi:hypothetical protein